MKQVTRKQYNMLTNPRFRSAVERFKAEPYQLRYQRLIKEKEKGNGK